jgi:hypothetical protein
VLREKPSTLYQDFGRAGVEQDDLVEGVPGFHVEFGKRCELGKVHTFTPTRLSGETVKSATAWNPKLPGTRSRRLFDA